MLIAAGVLIADRPADSRPDFSPAAVPRVFGCVGLHSGAPLEYVIPVHGETEEVCWDQPELLGLDADHAENDAVHAGDDPSLPHATSDQYGGNDRQDTREVIESHQ